MNWVRTVGRRGGQCGLHLAGLEYRIVKESKDGRIGGTLNRLILLLLSVSTYLTILSAGAAPIADDTVSTASLLREETDFSRLPLHRDWSAHLDSSYDRTGGNEDCQQFISMQGDTGLLADRPGPGALVRIWSTDVAKVGKNMSSQPTGILKIYIDDNPVPVINMPFADLFKGAAPFTRPLTTINGAAYFSYLPIPYAKRCRVTVDKPDHLFYQIDSLHFPEETKVRPFALPLTGEDQAALESASTAWTLPVPTPANASAPITLTIPAGSSADLPTLTGPGTVQSLVLSAPAVSDAGLRRLILRAWFDGHKTPDIEAPVADFFGNAYGHKVFESLFLSQNAAGQMTFRLPMPFVSEARFAIENGNGEPAAVEAMLAVKSGPIPTGSLYIRADFHQETTVRGRAHRWAHVEGAQGHFVGVVQTMQGGRTIGFCEGDDQVRVDAEKFIPSAKYPTVIAPSNGTGTEDCFNSAWYFGEGVKAGRLNGCLVRQDFGRIDTFRFYLNDAPVFQQSLDAQIEHGGLNDSTGEYYSSVAFWYGDGERVPLEPMPAAATLGFPKVAFTGDPIVIEGESLVPDAKATGGTVQTQEMKGLQHVWSNDCQLLWKGGAKGDTLTLPFDVAVAGDYLIMVIAGHGPTYGYCTFALNGAAVPRVIDGYTPDLQNLGPTDLVVAKLPAGKSTLVVTLGGKNSRSSGNDFGLDVIALRRAPKTSPR